MEEDMEAERQEQKATLTQELEHTAEAVGRLVLVSKPLIEKVASDKSVKEKTGWGASARRGEGKWDWTRFYAGILAVGQDRVLKGPHGETLDVKIRHKPGDKDEEPDDFSIRGGTDKNFFSLTQDRQYGYVKARYTTEKAVQFYDFSKDGVRVRITPLPLSQFAIFFEDAPFQPGKEGVIKLGKGPIKVAFTAADYHKTPLETLDDVVEWYKAQGFIDEDVGQVKEWLSNLPEELDWREALKVIEEQANQTVSALLSVANNPDLGRVWTREADDREFRKAMQQPQRGTSS